MDEVRWQRTEDEPCCILDWYLIQVDGKSVFTRRIMDFGTETPTVHTGVSNGPWHKSLHDWL